MDDKNLQYKRELGLNIKHYRLKSNYTQEQLAEKIGIGPKHLSRLETAKSAFRWTLCSTLPTHLKLSLICF